MNLNQLRLFHAVAERGSVGAAARELCLTQSAVSKGLRRFQDGLGVELLDSTSQPVRLTEAGAALHGVADQLFALEDRADEIVRGFVAAHRETLRIIATESFASYYLPGLVEQFQLRVSGVPVTIGVADTEATLRAVAERRQDLGIVSGEPSSPRLRTRRIHSEPLVLVAAPDHPLTRRRETLFRDLDGLSVIMHERGSTPRRLVDEAAERAGVRLLVPLETASTESLKHAVRDGRGLAFVSARAAERELDSGELVRVPLAGEEPVRHYYVVWHADRQLSANAEAFLGLVARGVA